MKTILEVSHNGTVIVESYERPKKKGIETIWTDKDNGIAEHEMQVDNIIIHEPILDARGRPTGRLMEIKISRYAFEAIARGVEKIKKTKCKPQFVD